MHDLMLFDLDSVLEDLLPLRLPGVPGAPPYLGAVRRCHCLLVGGTGSLQRIGRQVPRDHPSPQQALRSLCEQGLAQLGGQGVVEQLVPVVHLEMPEASRETWPALLDAWLAAPPAIGRAGAPARYAAVWLFSRDPWLGEAIRASLGHHFPHALLSSPTGRPIALQPWVRGFALPGKPSCHETIARLRPWVVPAPLRRPTGGPTIFLDVPGHAAYFAGWPTQPLESLGLTRLACAVEEDPATLTQITLTHNTDRMRASLHGCDRFARALDAGWPAGSAPLLSVAPEERAEYSLLPFPDEMTAPPLGWDFNLEITTVEASPLGRGALRLTGKLGGRPITVTARTRLPLFVARSVLPGVTFWRGRDLLQAGNAFAQLRDEAVLRRARGLGANRLQPAPISASFWRAERSTMACCRPDPSAKPDFWWWRPGSSKRASSELSLPGALLSNRLVNIAALPCVLAEAGSHALGLASPLPPRTVVLLAKELAAGQLGLGHAAIGTRKCACAVLLLGRGGKRNDGVPCLPIQAVAWEQLPPTCRVALTRDVWRELRCLPIVVDLGPLSDPAAC